MTRIGDLKERIEVWQSKPVKNHMGETIDDKVYVRSIWAQVTPSNGKREDIGLMQRAQITHRVVCRDFVMPDIKTDTFFIVRGQKLEVQYWYPVFARRGFMEIYCSEVIE